MSMAQYCHLANVRLLLSLNHWLAGNPAWHEIALALATRWGDVAILATLAALWFWPEPRPRDILQPLTLSPAAGKPGKSKAGATPKWRLAWPRRQPRVETAIAASPPPIRLSRWESRAQVLAAALGFLVIFVVTRTVADIIAIDPPPFSYLPLAGGLMADAFAGVQRVGSMPAAHAALLGAVPVALSYWNRALALAWGAAALLLAVAEVATGFHYPADAVAGFALGAAGMAWAMQMYDARGRAYDWAAFAARTFEPSNAPYCYFAYAFLVVFGYELLQHFQHIVNFVDAFYAALHQST